MKNTSLLTLILGLSLLTSVQLQAQKSTDYIHDYYEADAYHLTIKKINELKPKVRANADLQFILADCYWNIGYKKKSAQVYKSAATENAIPLDFQDKYQKAIAYYAIEDKKEELNSQELVIANNSLTDELKSTSVKSEEVLHQEVIARLKNSNNSLTNQENPTSAQTADRNETASLNHFPSSTAPSESLEVPSIIEVFRANDNKTSGAYRIRISIKTKNETEELKSLQSLKNVSSSKWEGKKIILAGYFDSVEEAADIIESYLNEDYKNISVVTKKGNKYKSVGTALASK